MKRIIIGIVLIVVALSGLIFWEVKGRELFIYDEVLILTQDVEPYTVIDEKMLGTIKVATKHSQSYTVADAGKVVGKEATQFIKAGTQLFETCFEDAKLVTHKDEYVLSIPNKWLQSYPQTLRRGDTVYFWCNGTKLTKATVVFVKDSSNAEVTSQDTDRLTGSSNVSLIEIITTEDQANLLSSKVEEGNQFVVLYN